MKIAVFHELHSGGARRAVNEFAKGLKKNHIVDLFIVGEAKEEKDFFTGIFSYKFVPKKWSGGNWKVKLYKDTIELYNLYKLHKKIAQEINRKNYDLVFIHPSQFTQAPFLLRFIKSKKIYYCQEPFRIAYEPAFKISTNLSLPKKIYENVIRWMRKSIDRQNINNADNILANSKNTQKSIMAAYGLKSTVCYLGVNIKLFNPSKGKKNSDILFIGSKDDIDGYSLLEKAISYMKKKPVLNTHITGGEWISDEELSTLYSKSKIVVCLARNEPFGLIALEAMACGVPVVAINDGGYKETVVDGKTGYLVERDAKKLAKKLDSLLSNETNRSKMGENARHHVEENWTWEKSVKNLEKNFQEPSNKKKYKVIILLGIFFFSFLLHLFTLNQIGRTWDEEHYLNHGYTLTELIRKGDFNNSYFSTSYDHPPLIKYLYGLTAHLDVQKHLPGGKAVFNYDLTYSRILSSIVFSLGVVLTVIIGWELISLSVGVMAGIILVMLPFTLGLSQLVTTESFKIFIYPLVIYAYIRLLQKYSYKNILFVGVITGIALQIKQSNALLFLIFGCIYLLYYGQMRQIGKTTFINKKSLSLLWIGLLSIVTFILLWPQLLFQFAEVYKIHTSVWNVQFSPNLWQITLSPPEVFFGRLIMTPTFYYIVYFFISIPVMILVFFFLGIKRIMLRKDWVLYSLAVWFIVPFVMSFYSWRQHGLRYIIEIYPAIALIAAVGFDALLSKFKINTKLKALYFLPVIIYLFIILWQVKPYYLDYFNEFVGGTNTVYKHKVFQQGWWGQGIREAGFYIKDTAPRGSRIGYALSPEHVLPRFDYFIYEKWEKNKKYDYVIVNHYNIIREGFDDGLIRKEYKLVYEVRADEAILAYVYKRK